METVRFRHAHFSARFPVGYRYSPSHFWLLPVDETDVASLGSPASESESSSAGRLATASPEPARLWRVGMTKFATRMLGELVDFTFTPPEGGPVSPGDMIGWVEGFKAASDVFCVMSGTFAGSNPALKADACIVRSDPYLEGWLYSVRGQPEPGHLDAQGYLELLNATITRMAEQEHPEE